MHDFSDTFVVYVGAERNQHLVHEAFALTSGFFAAAISGKWEEVNTNGVALPDQEPNLFKVYLEWLYTKAFTTDNDDSRTPPNVLLRLSKLYILGQYLLDFSFRNSVVDRVYEEHRHLLPELEEIEDVWRATPEGTSMRRIIAAMWAMSVREKDIAHFVNSLQPDIFTDLVRQLAARSSRKLLDSREQYHE